MEQWEKEQEALIKRQYELEHSKYVPISEKQQRKNMQRNWIEVVDENGNKHYIPKKNIEKNLSKEDSKRAAKGAVKPKNSGRTFRLVFILLLVILFRLYVYANYGW